MIKNYFKTAFRNLSRNRVYSFINIAGLSLGLACAMLIILYVKDEVSYDRFHANLNNIYRLVAKGEMASPDGNQVRQMGITGFVQGPKFASATPEILSFVRLMHRTWDIKTGNDVQSQSILIADSNFFSVFSFPLLKGNPRTALLSPDGVVISEDIAKRQYGTTDALGKIIVLKRDDQFIPFKITGIAKRCPQNSSIQFEIVAPLRVPAGAEQSEYAWGQFMLETYVLLAPNAKQGAVEEKIRKIYDNDTDERIQKIHKESKQQRVSDSYVLQPFSKIHLDTEVSREDIYAASDPIYSYILCGIAFFVLIIACINFVNLTIARSLKRAKEIGIRKVVGGSRKQLIIQFLGESFILCLLAFTLAVVIVKLTLPVFNDLSNKALAVNYLFDMKLVAGYILLFLLTGLLAGFYPALILSGYQPVETLYSRFKLAGKNYLQKSLVVLQFSLASFLIIATLIIFSQFNFLTTEKLGYDDSDLVLVNKDDLKPDQVKLIKAELMKNPKIEGVAPKDDGISITGAGINGDSGIVFDYGTIDPSFLTLLKIPILEGRNFSAKFPSDSSQSVIVNQSFVKKAGWKNPIGQQVVFGDKSNQQRYSVIGVIKDYHFQPLNQEIIPELLTMSSGSDFGTLYIKIEPKSETASLNYIEKTFRKLFPLAPFSFQFKDEENRKNYEAEAKWKQIVLFGAVLTIFISCIGLFGLTVLSAESRTKEIGIRKVLGASTGLVVAILSKDFLKLIIISLLLSIPLAWIAADKWLRNYPYRITLSWRMFIAGGMLVIFIALATISYQAIRAAMANPVKSLRTE
jgi:putative ABC transport system permease protein